MEVCLSLLCRKVEATLLSFFERMAVRKSRIFKIDKFHLKFGSSGLQSVRAGWDFIAIEVSENIFNCNNVWKNLNDSSPRQEVVHEFLKDPTLLQRMYGSNDTKESSEVFIDFLPNILLSGV